LKCRVAFSGIVAAICTPAARLSGFLKRFTGTSTKEHAAHVRQGNAVLLPSRPARFFFALSPRRPNVIQFRLDLGDAFELQVQIASAVFNDAHEITKFAARDAMVCAAFSRSHGGPLGRRRS
jgi:hypothetical protein